MADPAPPLAVDPLLARIEDAGLNASAPPQQRWMDGWLVRFSAGKAQRARCINAVAAGCRPLDEKLTAAEALYRAAGLPMLFRLTPFSQPGDLDAQLEARGWRRDGDTRVMVATVLPARPATALPAGLSLEPLSSADFAETVGALRGSSADARRAHAERLALSPVPYRGFVLRRGGDTLACGQVAQEDDLAGLYDVHTAPAARGRGFATLLCERLLALAIKRGARLAYLQVEADNHAARRVYARLGFGDRYAYHYRRAPGD